MELLTNDPKAFITQMMMMRIEISGLDVALNGRFPIKATIDWNAGSSSTVVNDNQNMAAVNIRGKLITHIDNEVNPRELFVLNDSRFVIAGVIDMFGMWREATFYEQQ